MGFVGLTNAFGSSTGSTTDCENLCWFSKINLLEFAISAPGPIDSLAIY
jgi:hypothetical protein